MNRLDVAAVVVIYEPPAEVKQRVIEYTQMFRHVVVVDNGEGAPCSIDFGEIDRLTVLWQGNRGGIAGALNRGLACTDEMGFAHALLLDQDSIVDSIEASKGLGAVAPDIGIVSLRPKIRGRAVKTRTTHSSPTIDVPVVMTAGSLISLQAYRRCGPFDESLFIDYVDHDYCLRLKRAGYRIAELEESELDHALGEPKRASCLGRQVTYISHRPFRTYYITRNGLFVAFRYMTDAPFVSAGVFKVLGKELVKTLAFEDHKWLRLRYMALGLLHWTANRYGPLMA